MSMNEFDELYLLYIYDYSVGVGQGKWHSLNELFTDLLSMEVAQIREVAQTLQLHGLIECFVTDDKQVYVKLTGKGKWLVESGGCTGIIPKYRYNLRSVKDLKKYSLGQQ